MSKQIVTINSKNHPDAGKVCGCGHVIYWTTRYGYRCHCSNPQPKNPQPKK